LEVRGIRTFFGMEDYDTLHQLPMCCKIETQEDDFEDLKIAHEKLHEMVVKCHT
jgi:hypothetical protein